jgi:glycosyltransferase involved in cell wall biosynthesis
MERKKKALYIVTKSNFGGTQRYVYDLATNLSPERFEPVVAAGGNGILFKKLKAAGVRTIPLPHLGRDVSLIADIRSFFDILSLLRSEKPDVLHLNSSKIGALGALAGRLFFVPRIIFTAHGWAFNEDRSLLSRLVIKGIAWLTMMLSHETIAVSESMRRNVANLPGTRRIKVIRNGIDPVELLPELDAKMFLVTHGIPADRPIVGTLAELHPIKGLRYAIEAIERLRERGLTASLVIFGEGEQRAELEECAQKSGVSDSVFFLGFVPDASSYLSGLDVFILSSLSEGLSYAILEAGSASLPVTASRVGGIPEVVEDGVSGILVPPQNPTALAQAIAALLEDGERYGAALSKRIATEFSLERMSAETTALYR